jgi:hypothetical protein
MHIKTTDLPPTILTMRSAENEMVTSVAPRSLVFFSPQSAGSSALKFSASSAQPASDGELCRRRMEREVDLTMPLWWAVGG